MKKYPDGAKHPLWRCRKHGFLEAQINFFTASERSRTGSRRASGYQDCLLLAFLAAWRDTVFVWLRPEAALCSSWSGTLDSCLRRNDRVGIHVHSRSSVAGSAPRPRHPLRFKTPSSLYRLSMICHCILKSCKPLFGMNVHAIIRDAPKSPQRRKNFI